MQIAWDRRQLFIHTQQPLERAASPARPGTCGGPHRLLGLMRHHPDGGDEIILPAPGDAHGKQKCWLLPPAACPMTHHHDDGDVTMPARIMAATKTALMVTHMAQK